MLIGAHISSWGGVQNAPYNAHRANCEVFQFFSRPPQGGKALVLTPAIIKKFKSDCQKYHLKESYIHAPYFINLASEKNNVYYGSIAVLREELERGSELGVKYMMTHLGSAKDLGRDAINRVSAGIAKILAGYQGNCQFLIEMSAGAGMIIGDNFEEIAEIIKLAENESKTSRPKSEKNSKLARRSPAELRDEGGQTIGVCYDTAHAFESGYDIRTAEVFKKTFDEFDKILGLECLKLIHANDSKTDLGSHLDRHEHIGQGKIGLTGFRALLNEPRLKKINLIVETPADGKRVDDVKVLKRLRNSNPL